MGTLLGVTFGVALLGALIAWIIRKARPMTIVKSYSISIPIGTLIYMAVTENLYAMFGTMPGIALGVICGFAAFGLLYLTSKRSRQGA